MPTPGGKETKEQFLERCIPIVLDEGTAKDGDQAYAICNSMWEQDKKKEAAMYVKTDEMERRCLPSAEMRLAGTDDAPKITGYAAVFDTWADIGGWFRESIRKGAFAKTVKENDIRALVNHNENYVLGRNKAGTLKLREDSKGLAVEITPPDTIWANDLLASMRRGDINQMSFGFNVNKQEINYERDERVLEDVTLFDVSVVTYPAYPTTSAEVRAAFEKKKVKDERIPVTFTITDPTVISTTETITEIHCGHSELDRLINKIKSGEEFSEEEARIISDHLRSLGVPPAKHTPTETEPPAKHSVPDTRKKTVAELLIQTARIVAPNSCKEELDR